MYTERRFVKSYADGKGAKDMTLSLQDFLSSLVSNPMLILTVLLTLGVCFVIVPPNPIGTGVSTRSMGPRAAI